MIVAESVEINIEEIAQGSDEGQYNDGISSESLDLNEDTQQSDTFLKYASIPAIKEEIKSHKSLGMYLSD